MVRNAIAVVALWLCACTQPSGSERLPAQASAPQFSRPSAAAGAPASSAAALPSGSAEAGAPDAAGAGEPAGSASAAAPPPASAEPLPAVEIENVGMHIGGGPNDAATKAPIRQAIQAHYDELSACYRLAENKSRKATFGVDLRVPAAGGPAKVEKVRFGLKGEGINECLTQALERIALPAPPSKQPTVVSYSLRFSPVSGKR
ncbi:MAG: hypothetical protein HY744_14405 [Deltaproteobacteria bacterium]|nr:hypothetical protein [Deltaproteobacteria bacterium]